MKGFSPLNTLVALAASTFFIVFSLLEHVGSFLWKKKIIPLVFSVLISQWCLSCCQQRYFSSVVKLFSKVERKMPLKHIAWTLRSGMGDLAWKPNVCHLFSEVCLKQQTAGWLWLTR